MLIVPVLGHISVLTLPRSTALLSLPLMWTPPKAGSGLCFHDLVLRFGLCGRCLERNICKEALEMPTWIAPHSLDSAAPLLALSGLCRLCCPARQSRGKFVSLLLPLEENLPSGRAVFGSLLFLDPREHFHICRPRGPSGP